MRILRLKSGVAVSIFDHDTQKEVEKSVFFDDRDEIIRIERHQAPIVIEPLAEVSFYRIWTRNAFDSF